MKKIPIPKSAKADLKANENQAPRPPSIPAIGPILLSVKKKMPPVLGIAVDNSAFDRTVGIDFTNPDFVMLAKSFGAKGVRIGSAEELKPALAEALDAGGVWLLDVPVDYSENIRLTEKLLTNSCEL